MADLADEIIKQIPTLTAIQQHDLRFLFVMLVAEYQNIAKQIGLKNPKLLITPKLLIARQMENGQYFIQFKYFEFKLGKIMSKPTLSLFINGSRMRLNTRIQGKEQQIEIMNNSLHVLCKIKF